MSQKYFQISCVFVAILLLCSCKKEDRVESPKTFTDYSKYNPTASGNKFAIFGNIFYCVGDNTIIQYNIDILTGELIFRESNFFGLVYGQPAEIDFIGNNFFISTNTMFVRRQRVFSGISNTLIFDQNGICASKAFNNKSVAIATSPKRCNSVSDNKLTLFEIGVAPREIWSFIDNNQNYKGITANEETLFACKNNSVEIININNQTTRVVIGEIEINNPINVQVNHKTLFVTAEDGLYQYDIEDVYDVKFLSKLAN